MSSRRSIEILASVALLASLAACSVTPQRTATAAALHSTGRGKSGPAGMAAQSGAGSERTAAGFPPVPPPAKEEFERALALARAGDDTAAEAQLANVARQYPQFSTPLIDLGILRRKDGDLERAAKALQAAAARDPHSARAWTELGITQRLEGKFQDAHQSYARAIAADPAYGPAYRDRGVLRDLYLDEPAAALSDFEQYRKLAGDDKPVAMWIAELSHRTGIKVPASGAQPPGAAAVASGRPPAAATSAPAQPPQARN